jgi:hypothetical protein
VCESVTDHVYVLTCVSVWSWGLPVSYVIVMIRRSIDPEIWPTLYRSRPSVMVTLALPLL